jgi:tricorn protease-like protein
MPPPLAASKPAHGRPPRRHLRRRLAGFAALAALVMLTGVPAGVADTVLVDASISKELPLPLGGNSVHPAVSATAGMIVFASDAVNLVNEEAFGGLDTNGVRDVFVRYRGVPVTIRVSVSSHGTQGNSVSDRPSIDDFAELVAFESYADNLVDDDTNGERDIFVHNLSTRRTSRVSVSSRRKQANDGSSQPAIDGSGRFVAFTSRATNLVLDDTNDTNDVFVHDLTTGETSRVSVSSPTHGNGASVQGNRPSTHPSISDGGRFVAFSSQADNLVADDTNGAEDVFVHDRDTGKTTRVSVGSGGTQANGSSRDSSISADGRFVAFSSQADNLVADDTNIVADVFRHDRASGQTQRWSVASDGSQATLGGTVGSVTPAITNAGDKITFSSDARGLVPGDTVLTINIFLRDP